MEFFTHANFNFMGRTRLFVGLSLVLTLAGLLSLALKKGPKYSIDFTGGAMMEVRWNGTPPIEKIRAALPTANIVAAHSQSEEAEILLSSEVRHNEDMQAVRQRMTDALSPFSSQFTVRSFEIIGPQIGGELRKQALLAVATASAGMLGYLAWRFRLVYGAAAVLAVLHDTLITVGLFSLFDFEISMTVVAALLTLIGYSMNDTIVVFDRIKENRQRMPREAFDLVVNLSINQTLSRTILTSGLTLSTAFSLFVFGGPVLYDFSFALVVGIIAGTYSSIFVASPILLLGGAK